MNHQTSSLIQPSLLGKMNERQVLKIIQKLGPSSRAEVTRYSGISAPTVSKAVSSLLELGLLEEDDVVEPARGRPAKKVRLATESAQVLGVVIDATQCRVVSASLDGALHEGGLRQFSTPGSYDGLIAELAQHATELMNANGAQTFGLGISLPGLIDDRQQRGILSPNLPMTNGQSPASDLSDRLGVECVMLQEADALCLAERHYGIAGDDLEDFAMLDVSTGVGLGVCSGGRLLKGHRGLAGEIGHITVRADGRQCGCGNVGCLETEASDSAFAWAVSNRLGEKLHIGEVLARVQSGEISVAKELEQTSDYLAIGMAAVINLFNPSTLFIYGRLFEADETLFDRLIEKTENRSLTPSFADCRIVQAQGSKRHGAVAGIVQHLTNSLVPGAV